MKKNKLSCPCLQQLIRNALKEDIGRKDITTQLIIPKNNISKAVLLAKEDFLLCGIEVFSAVFKTLDKNIKLYPQASDGRFITKGTILAKIEGRTQSLLTAERVALNLLSLLCAIATKTRRYVDAIKPYKTKILDTRKTIPGLRELQKYAVRIGGGSNHRMRLDEMVLIKDNHLASLTSYSLHPAEIINKIRKKIPKIMKIEIEVKNLKEFKEALKARPDIIMLDNMNISNINKAVAMRPKIQNYGFKTQIEVSGGITLKNIKKFASTGVDMISVGSLTHSVASVDISLEII